MVLRVFSGDVRPFHKTITLFALVFCALALYLPSVRSGFVEWDDPQYVVQNGAELAAPLFSGITRASHGYYQPLTILSYRIDYRIGGLSPRIYHLTNSLLHAANAALVFLLCGELAISAEVSFWAALIFCVHPMLSEPVLWVSGRKDLLMCFFGLLGLLAYMRRSDKNKWSCMAAANLCAAFAILAKPTAMALPLIYPLADYLHGRREWRKYFLYMAPALFVGLCALYFSLHASRPLLHEQNNGGWRYPLACLNNLWFYYSHLLWPAGLSPEYPYIFRGGFLNFALLPLLACGVTGALLYAGKGGRFCSGFFLLALLPVLARPEMAPSDRYVYFPVCGLVFGLGFALDFLRRRSPKAGGMVLSLLAVAVVLLAAGTVRRRAVWHDDVSLWRDAWSKYPCSADCAVNAADRLEKAGLHADTLGVYAASEACGFSGETRDKLAYDAGLACAKSGDLRGATLFFISISPSFAAYDMVLNNLGMAALLEGDKKSAARYFRAALHANPSCETAKQNLSKL
jgi:hypothetical protein